MEVSILSIWCSPSFEGFHSTLSQSSSPRISVWQDSKTLQSERDEGLKGRGRGRSGGWQPQREHVTRDSLFFPGVVWEFYSSSLENLQHQIPPLSPGVQESVAFAKIPPPGIFSPNSTLHFVIPGRWKSAKTFQRQSPDRSDEIRIPPLL